MHNLIRGSEDEKVPMTIQKIVPSDVKKNRITRAGSKVTNVLTNRAASVSMYDIISAV